MNAKGHSRSFMRYHKMLCIMKGLQIKLESEWNGTLVNWMLSKRALLVACLVSKPGWHCLVWRTVNSWWQCINWLHKCQHDNYSVVKYKYLCHYYSLMPMSVLFISVCLSCSLDLLFIHCNTTYFHVLLCLNVLFRVSEMHWYHFAFVV